MIQNKIKQLREQARITQDDMAIALNISQNAYCLLENGKTKMDVERLFKIAELLNTNPGNLLDFTDTIFDFNDKVENSNASYIQTLSAHNKELIAVLRDQLNEKDKQIENLLNIMKGK